MELELHRLDCIASHGIPDNYEFLMAERKKMDSEPILPPHWINGHDIIALGQPPGPAVGRWLEKAYNAQLNGNFTGREDLMQWLAGQIRESESPQ